MTTSYVPIRKAEMNDLLLREMGFSIMDTDRSSEMIYSRDVTTNSGVKYPFEIKVYSSVQWKTGWSDECGKDAIRVVLLDKKTKKPAVGKQRRVHRTKNAKANLRKRCRDLYRQVLTAEYCPCCGGMLHMRENRKTGHKFFGCSRYAPGKEYHCDFTKEITA